MDKWARVKIIKEFLWQHSQEELEG